MISKPKKTPSIGSLETVSGLTCELRKIAQGFADYFRTAIVKIRQHLFFNPITTAQSLETRSVFRLSRVEEDYVCKELKKIKTSKSTGLENIPARLLKDNAVALAKPLTLLMNRSLAEGAIPSDWKHASVTPIHKAGSMLPTIGLSLLYLSLLYLSRACCSHHGLNSSPKQPAFVYLSVRLSTTAFHKHLPHRCHQQVTPQY